MRRGYVYAKGQRLYLAWYDAQGKRRLQAAGLPVGEEKEAERRLRALQDQVASVRAVAGTGPLTVRAWSETWIERRKERGVKSVGDDEARTRDHILPELGDIPIAELGPKRVRAWVLKLKKKGKLAPRTVHHVYDALRLMMAEAVVDELIPATPCVLLPGDLPEKKDKDPRWRAKAIYSREEVELLISDPRIPAGRRVAYALLALAGLRWGEMAGLRWRDYDRSIEPLGRLTVAEAYSTRRKRIDSTKTEVTRLVPVHPTLAAVLAQARGDAGPDDLISPSDRGTMRSVNIGLRSLHRDLATLGLRARRSHDLRRTFISLARAAGATKDQVGWITHTPSSADVIDGYTTLEWGVLCDIVRGVRVDLRRPEGEVIQLRRAAGAATALLPPKGDSKKAPQIRGLAGLRLAGRTGLEPVPDPHVKPRKTGDHTVKYSTSDSADPITSGTDTGRSGASGSSSATASPEATIRAALAGLDPSEARALLIAMLSELG